MSLTPAEEAVARARTFGWLAEILLDGWTERAIAVGRTLAWLPELPEGDTAAVRRQRVMGEVPPYESVFCSQDGLLGGGVAASIRIDYDQIGFRTDRRDIEPDHVGLQCAAMSFLHMAEADALRDGVPTKRLIELREGFLKAHLARFSGMYAVAIERQGIAEWSAIASLLHELVGSPEPIGDEPEALLDDPKTGLKDVARYLTVPARCGAWLARPDIQRIAAAAELACGFGKRVNMLESLLFSAVDHEQVAALAAAFEPELAAWEPAAPARIAATRDILARLAEAADS